MNAPAGAKPDSETKINSASLEPFGQAASLTILVVEDDEMVRHFIIKTLERAGYRVLSASDGQAAIHCIDRDGVDLIITDLCMPQMDGLELVMQLRQQAHAIPVIAISGAISSHSEDMLRTARLLGAKLTLAKPFLPHELVAAVRQLAATLSPNVAP